MNDYPTLESALEARAANDRDAKDFWNKYESMKRYLSASYYPWIQANCKFFTDHGEGHIQSVIQSASSLLSKNLSFESTNLSSLDLFIILSAILWHDVGNVYGRSDHATHIVGITDEVRALGFPNPDIHRLIVEISKAHAGEEGLKSARQEEDCTTSNRTYTVQPRALAAIVRFADEISENRSRISEALLPNVPDENRIFWEYANCISASRPDPARERIIVTVALQADKVVRRFRCLEFPTRVTDASQISLIEYVLCRLEKMNNERAYCAPEFRRYASIRQIEARFTILHGSERLENYEEVVVFGDSSLNRDSYPNIRIFDEFFNSYPIWRPEALEEVLHQ